MRWSVLVRLWFASTLMVAQESPLAAELRREASARPILPCQF